MKKFWMMLAIAGLFSATVVSCGEKKEGGEAEKTEAPAEEAAPAETPAEETAAPAETPAAVTAAAPATEEATH